MPKNPSIQPSKHDTPKKSSPAGKLKVRSIEKTSRREAPSAVEEPTTSGVTEFMNPQPTNGDVEVRITQRAYELFHRRGGHHGQDLDDWLVAEQEVLAEEVS